MSGDDRQGRAGGGDDSQLSWRRERSEQVADCRVFKVRRDHSADPRGGRVHDFYVIEAPDWINVIPLTKSGEVVFLGRTRPNPAIQDNWIHTFLARDCERRHEPLNHGTEQTRVRLVAPGSVPALIGGGEISHALVVTAFHWLGLRGL